jgi:uncharacterized protein (TIRG00374 family)
MPLSRRTRTIATALFSLFLFGLCFYLFKVDVHALLRIWATLDARFIVPAFALNVAMLCLRAGRWRLILNSTPGEPRNIAFGRVFSTLNVGYLANQLFPAPTGEVTRAVILARSEGMKTVRVFSTIVVERVLDALALAPVIVFVLVVIPLPLWLERLVFLAGIALVAIAVAGVIVHSRREQIVRAGAALIRRLPASVQDRLAAFRGSFAEGLHILRDLRGLAAAYAQSLGAWVLQLAVVEMVAQSLHQPLNLRVEVLIVILANAGTLLPFAPGNLGTFQALTMTTLAVFHVRPEVSLSIALAYQAVQFLPVAVLGLHTLWSRGLRIEEVKTSSPP